MSASALPQYDREDFAPSLAAFAKALFGPPTGCGPETDYPATKAVAEAIGAAGASTKASEARILAYRALVGRFLRTWIVPGPSADSFFAAASERRQKPTPTDADLTLVALHQLAPVERATLLLVVVGRFSYADAAAVMDMEVTSFKAALARGREAFAARLACAKGGGRSHLRLVG